MSSDEDPDVRRSLPRDSRSSNSSPRENLPSSAPTLPPLRSLGTRRPATMLASNHSAASTRARPSERIAGISRVTSPWADAYEDALDLWDHWEDDLAVEQRTQDPRQPGMDANSQSSSTADGRQSQRLREDETPHLRAIVDFTQTASPLPELFPSLSAQQHEPPEENRQAKRRKLDSDRLSSNFQGFQYGKYGQIQPGHLKMELVSCDGGIYLDNTAKYAAENILKNDGSVYCTEGPRCNIVLRHQGATVFTLKELVIKAPRSNFDSPVQAGMVFVAMTSDHLLNRTAQYQIQYLPPSRHAERETPFPPILSIRHNEDGRTMTSAQMRARRSANMELGDEDNDDDVAQIPSEFNISPPPFQVITECSDDEADDRNVRLYGRAPNRIGSLPFESDLSEEDEGVDDFPASGIDYALRRRRDRSRIALAEAAEAVQIATQEAVRAVGGELLTPHARFHIERNKSKCTIRFNPPISGRFILLKMWNPRRNANANIDIQAVIAKGFAGPRFFPSIELQ
ncbi:hypothetical protein GGS21DRAFT_544732 [Xylaria nigripes]|nr:hypothetical protein GGS21DRAFT_544732 [Xylaria nigripes]